MNLHIRHTLKTPPLNQPRHGVSKSKAKHYLGTSKQLPNLLWQMLKILYAANGEPVFGAFNGRKALVFNGRVVASERTEYPVLVRESDGTYRVYSLMNRPGREPWTYMMETLTPTDWVPTKFY